MRRELNEIEYFNWCVGQPYNMVAAVRLHGDLDPGRLRQALDRAQQRHPLLRVNTELGPSGLPWFSSDGVGTIPLAVLDSSEPEAARRLAEAELTATFAMDGAGSPRLPLLRVTLLLPREPAEIVDLVLTAQHVIADGLSMVFLVQDLLHFMARPDAPLPVLDAAASPADLLPAEVRRRIPTSPLRFRLVHCLARIWVRLLFGRRAAAPKERSRHHRSWELTPDQTSRLRVRCREEGVTVQAAICTAFLGAFVAVHIPVNLRPLLARPVGEAVGLFVGAAEVRLRYREARGFWGNARRFQLRLRRALRNPFGVLQLFSKAVPAEEIRQVGALLVAITAGQRPFAVTNLGDLDRSGVQLQGPDLRLESFTGAVTGIVDSSVLTVYTLGGSMRLHLLATEAGPTDTAVRDDAERSMRLLLGAIDQ
jgi:hypothetical protein